MSQWPSPSKPYFMIVVDSSRSMDLNVATNNSCGYQNNRIGHARCAVKNTVQAFSGEVNFGLSMFAWRLTGTCGATCTNCAPGNGCFPGCTVQWAPGDNNSYCGATIAEPSVGTVHAGGYVIAPMLQDHFWLPPPDPTNVPTILGFVDNNCNTSVSGITVEVGAASNTPLGGTLYNMYQYFSGTYQDPFTAAALASPIGPATYNGNPAERACRPINVILITDGDETCDYYNTGTYPNHEGLAVFEANRLYGTGVTVNGQNFKIKTHVIGFTGATQVALDHIAAAGGTTASYSTADETQLSQALATIIGGAVKPETCDNADNNCNGCTDEGYSHFCDQSKPCCAWGTDPQRTTCLNNYKASITPSLPKGDLSLLPCTTPVQQTDPLHWLCYDPTEVCDNIDNNCNGQVDEGFTKCGSPLHCPQVETCNNKDDNCDGLIDEGGVCGTCAPSSEVCDGCDNNCNGMTDDNVASVPCGLPTPANCAGTLSCKPGQLVPIGTCAAGGGWNACNNNPQTEVCDNVDNNCDGIIDNGIASVACIGSNPPGLNYGANSQCKQGTTQCTSGVTSCNGVVGPSAEVCDGIDNNCDGTVDNGIAGLGQPCGINQGICKPGVTACVNGAIVCQGGVQPQAEICDGIDNNCNGQTDEAPLADAPGAGLGGCWNVAGNCCTFGGLSWCAPAGATCNDNGTLTAPCNKGALTCQAGAWACVGPKGPSAEVCDAIDNNCDGQVDNGIPQVGQTCGTNTGECTAGTFKCTAGILSCNGSVGPTPEQCNGKDDDCDGAIDNNVQGLGVACGNSTPPCTPGVTACVGGQIICQGGKQPTAETCNGIDDNCDGQVDNAPLTDAPLPGQTGCWTLPGNCCSFGAMHWCPPSGGACYNAGTLTVPCQAGALACVAGGWGCVGSAGPSAEVCDSIDNNCDGVADNIPVTQCVPPGTPGGLVYGGTSQCKMGTKGCGPCAGFVGPTPEICDGIDNNCNGQVDENAAGTGTPCGINLLPCSLGITACVNGALICQGGVQPQPEVCDGIDNNCNGSVDEAPLADAPGPGQNGCWMDPGNCCTFLTLSWCPPAGGTCQDNGTLSPPCNKGFLSCGGLTGWKCVSAKGPSPEVCDGIDNNCNGTVDDGIPNGAACGSGVGECKQGIMQCAAGILSCVGEVTPTDEICDGKDNNCNGQIDDGIPTGGPCSPPYDTTAYPGDRSQGACQPGVAECDGNGGLKCVGGVGPQPEICDGIDNDCDGLVDEVGAAPNGIDGTQNPQPDPNAKIGDACGAKKGECTTGAYGCLNGIFACLGGQGPVPEQCDCLDNNCDGTVDNENGDGGPPLCGAGKSCIKDGTKCECAAPCGGGEFKCPGGQTCKDVFSSSTGEPLGQFCVPTVDLCGGDCTSKTVKDSNNKVICAPTGTDPAGCVNTPVCTCNDNLGCQEPCAGITCSGGKVCANFGPNAGHCVQDSCFQLTCQGCNKACNLGACVDNPCKPGVCPSGKECKPKENFVGFDCVSSCAGVTCQGGKVCVDGTCVASCVPTCTGNTVCDPTTKTCVANKCVTEGGTSPCTNGSCCDPLTGACGNCPCEGIVCPDKQKCDNGQCTGNGTGGAAGSAGAGGSAGGKQDGGPGADAGGAAGGKIDGGDAGSVEQPHGVIGLATGGGGCMCRTTGLSTGGASRFALALGALAGLLLLRRSRRNARRES